MTERKSTEIKFRVTPSFKARVQSAADAAGVSLTEYLEGASEGRMAEEEAGHEGYRFLHQEGAPFGEYTHPAKNWVGHWQTGTSNPQITSRAIPAPKSSKDRRKEPCTHSKPPYAFCAECDR